MFAVYTHPFAFWISKLSQHVFQTCATKLNRFVCLHQAPAGWSPASECPLYAGTCSTVTITHYYYSSTHYLFNVLQGPLEKSLQNSVVSERQRNVEHKVSAIKNSAQVWFWSSLLFMQPWFSYRHTWTNFKLGSANTFANKLCQPFSIILRTSAQTNYSGHTWTLRFLQLLWVQRESYWF